MSIPVPTTLADITHSSSASYVVQVELHQSEGLKKARFSFCHIPTETCDAIGFHSHPLLDGYPTSELRKKRKLIKDFQPGEFILGFLFIFPGFFLLGEQAKRDKLQNSVSESVLKDASVRLYPTGDYSSLFEFRDTLYMMLDARSE